MTEHLDLSELEGVYTERSMVTEATQRETVRKGDYNATIVKVTTKRASDESPYPNRSIATLQLAVQNGTGKVITKFQDVSWQIYREASVGGERVLMGATHPEYDTSLKLDKPSKLWGQIEKVFNSDATLSIPEVLTACVGSQVGTYIMEGFKNDSGEIKWPQARPNDFGSYELFVKAYDGEKSEAASGGYLPVNYISNFHAVRV